MTVRTGVWFFPDASSGTIVETIEAAEAAGLDEIWLGDEGPGRDPFALLAAGARNTRRIKLGVGVTNPYLRHAATIASAALTIHELSNGRMVLGLGPGGDLALGPVHVQRTRPLEATREAVRIIRAVSTGQPTEGYTPTRYAVTGPDLPIFIGARGERFNRFASEAADGVFLGGIPKSRLQPTVNWAHSVRKIAVSAYPAALFDETRLEAIRPRMIYALLDAPEVTSCALGVDRKDARAAAQALAQGDPEPARRLIDDQRLDELVIHGSPQRVGEALANRLGPLQPTSIGVALLSDDPLSTIAPAAEALAIAARKLR
ncbi:MAG TPA: LLM class flavin-dependent oxidoreductase [Chloroflexota bacterium]